MATFGELTDSVDRIVYFMSIFILVLSHFGLDVMTLVLTAAVPGQCLSNTFLALFG